MKAIKLFAALTILVFVATSCKNENELKAEKNVNQYASYVDSIIKVEPEVAAEDWVDIEASAEFKKSEALEALDAIEGREIFDSKLEESSKKFDVYKEGVESKMEVASGTGAGNTTQTTPLSKSLFGIVIGKDLNFNWVNKDNIHQVYKNFVNTVSANKKTYSREDWDEIKLLYEALDTRKNTVEKEGLSTKDNLKIATLKTEFATMFKLNRIGAKSEENSDAKS
ncbi:MULTISPECIES: hypothetical protein [Flavobacterium]|uniref:Lipoprotein n=1 Tax=Flavobacterium hankyongi TaxID=1176532 RepID=A0ABP8ZVC2_9FLAO|nr:hypothetical protein [Flavobacterium sp. N1846]